MSCDEHGKMKELALQTKKKKKSNLEHSQEQFCEKSTRERMKRNLVFRFTDEKSLNEVEYVGTRKRKKKTERASSHWKEP